MSFIRLALASSLVLTLTACGGGGIGNILGPTQLQCDPGTQVQLARPAPGQTGVAGNIGQIIIVANGNNNTLYNTSAQWYLTLTDQFGNTLQGSNLSPYSYPGGPQPYASDFYYSSTFGQLTAGTTYTAKLNEQNANCLPVPLNSFST